MSFLRGIACRVVFGKVKTWNSLSWLQWRRPVSDGLGACDAGSGHLEEHAIAARVWNGSEPCCEVAAQQERARARHREDTGVAMFRHGFGFLKLHQQLAEACYSLNGRWAGLFCRKLWSLLLEGLPGEVRPILMKIRLF